MILSRLEYYRGSHHVFPEDVRKIRQIFGEIQSDAEAVMLWQAYSDYLCASWLIVEGSTIEGFREWLYGSDVIEDVIDE